MTFSSYKPKHYLPHIDGLRGIAVLVILLFHLDVSIFKGGFVGVDIFFVISGYLITSIIARDIEKKEFSFFKFYARRVRRIFPALFFMLLVTGILALFFLGPSEFSEHYKVIRMAAAQISNFYFARELDYFALDQDVAPLLHTWSLGVEEQFYLVWPLLLVGIRKLLGLQRAFFILCVILLISLGVSEYLVRTDAMQAFYMLHARAWELAMGGIVALGAIPAVTHQKWREGLALLGLALIAGSSLLIEEKGFPGLKAVPPCLGAALFIYATQSGECRAQKVLAFKPLVFCGLISYSLYLWHWPFIAFYKSYFGAELNIIAQVGIAGLSFLCAVFSYRFIEQPFRVMPLAPKKAIAAGVCTIVLFILISNVVKNQSKADWRVTYSQDEAVVRPHTLFKTCAVEGGAYDQEHCYIGPNKEAYEVVLAGDSFASHYTPAVLAWAQEKGLTVRLMARGACPVWIKSKHTRIKAGKVDHDCMKLTDEFFNVLENQKTIRYVFLGLRGTKIDDDVRASLKEIAGYHKQTYYLGVGPLFSEHPHNCQINNSLLISKYIPRAHQRGDCLEIDWDLTNDELSPFRADFKPYLDTLGIPYFDPLKYMQTPFDDNGVFLFADAGHMNEYGGLYLAPYLTAFIAKHDETR